LRITGGQYKGRKLICPPGVIRPAMDRMRESLFAILGDIRGSSFLDLYCGSGSVGIEAASRGAEPVVFVEKDRGKRSILERNASFVEERTEFHFLPVEHFLRRVKLRFDLIFLDPPFRQRGKIEVLELIAARAILAQAGTLLIHVPKEEEETFPSVVGTSDDSARGGRLRLADRRLYGGSLLLFYQ
jgi:16S rRNA (guanine966-N2)-methyltransferase